MAKVLIIEDEIQQLNNICQVLKLEGYETLQAENGKIGLEMALTHLPDLIICDINMPEMDGFGVLKALQGNPRVSAIPFIFLTVFSTPTHIDKAFKKGIDAYIIKPFSIVDLLNKVKTHIRD